MASNTLDLAQAESIRRLRAERPDARFWRAPTYPDHLVDWWDNLIDGVTRTDCGPDLDRGAGSETRDRHHKSGATSPAKFCAPYSSSALAVNTFGPFRHHPNLLRLDGKTGFQSAQFEYPCTNGLRTQHLPHFDLFADSPAGVIAVEAKFLEPLGDKKVEFKPQYDGPFEGASDRRIVAEEPWRETFRALKSGALRYQHLDAAQLMKHYLGLIVKFELRPRTLRYLFWEPENAADVPEFVLHRAETEDFARRVSDCASRFAFGTYTELWQDWEQNSTWPGMPTHLARLRARYAFML